MSSEQLSFEDFCQRLLSLFDEGRFTATYKYAVLIGLLEVLSVHVGPTDELPNEIRTRELAQAVLELYWPHTRPFVTRKPLGIEPRVLQQNRRGQAEILSMITTFRDKTVGDSTLPLGMARSSAPHKFEQLVRRVEFKLIEMPLGKLQVRGGVPDTFIYRLNWDGAQPPRWSEVNTDGFVGLIHLRPGVASHLLRASALLRPLVQREWALTVSSFNDDLLGDELDEFLFGAARVSLTPIHTGLRELAAGRCFYCSRTVDGAAGQIDHFVPWTRHIDNGLANLVYAHASCNNSKRAYLAAEAHLERWIARLLDAGSAAGLARLAGTTSWDYEPETSVAAARGVYRPLYSGYPLWVAPGNFEPADPRRIADILNVTP